MINLEGLLMIEPGFESYTKEPVIDEYTRKMFAAYSHAKRRDLYLGHHQCSCGAVSTPEDLFLDGIQTNSLAVHYLAHHRADVPQEELDKVASLSYGEKEPTEEWFHPIDHNWYVDVTTLKKDVTSFGGSMMKQVWNKMYGKLYGKV